MLTYLLNGDTFFKMLDISFNFNLISKILRKFILSTDFLNLIFSPNAPPTNQIFVNILSMNTKINLFQNIIEYE